MEIRSVKGSDYYVISPLINEWWGGRQMSDKLPKLFFDHFKNTSFIAEKDGKIVGFLIGFLEDKSFFNFKIFLDFKVALRCNFDYKGCE
jgi:hypothetical protein